jgi:SpoIID/LytB domain protein
VKEVFPTVPSTRSPGSLPWAACSSPGSPNPSLNLNPNLPLPPSLNPSLNLNLIPSLTLPLPLNLNLTLSPSPSPSPFSSLLLPLFLCLLVSFPALAQVDEGGHLTRKDRSALLYQTKFLFTADHVPIITVLVMEDRTSVEFQAGGPMAFLPEGDGGSVIRVGKDRTKCTADLADGQPARIRHWVALARTSARDSDASRRARDEWEARGTVLRTFELGSIFGFYGRVLDNRVRVLVEDRPFDDAAKAMARRNELAEATGAATVDLFEEVMERPSGTVRIRCDGVPTAMEFPDLVWVEAAGEGGIRVRRVEFGKGFPWHGFEDRSYRGRLVLTPDRNGRLAVVNAVDAETLLKGLVPSEIYVDAPEEALKAQAVCARAEVFAKLGTRHTADPYMVCADVHCQVYRGMEKEHPRTSRAVEATRGEMAFADDGLVDAVYSSTCGGHSESGSSVWQGSGHDYLVGVPDGPPGTDLGDLRQEKAIREFINDPPKDLYCGSTRYGRDTFRWKKTVTADTARSGIKAQAGTDIGTVKEMKVLERGVSGRVTRLEVSGSKGSIVLSPELRIRKALGSLRSSMFVVEPVTEGGTAAWQFVGGGFGHGVGMCQVGAIGMAAKGIDYRAILRHYYQDSEVVKIY